MKKLVTAMILVIFISVITLSAHAAGQPTITLQPQSPNYPEYSCAVYTVKAEGSNLTATWYLEYKGKTYNTSKTIEGVQPWEGYAGESYGATRDKNTFYFFFNGIEKELCGGEPNTTNNRMELTAIIKALSALKEPCHVTLTSDSKYALDALEKGWAISWRAKGWKKADKSPALNPDLWEELLNLVSKHEMEYVWVKGHAGHPYNERCDAMAQGEAAKIAADTPPFDV